MERHFIRLAAIALLTCVCACQAAQEPLTLEEEWEEPPAVIAAPAAQPEEPPSSPVLEEKDRVELSTRVMAEKPRLAERESSYKVAVPVEDSVAEPAEDAAEEGQDHTHPSQLYYYQPAHPKKPIPLPEESELMI